MVATFQVFDIIYQHVGIRIIDSGDNEIVMEAAIQWDGDPSIILAVELLNGFSLPVQVICGPILIDIFSEMYGYSFLTNKIFI